MKKWLLLIFFITMVFATHTANNDTAPSSILRPNDHRLERRARRARGFLEAVTKNDIASAKDYYKKNRQDLLQTNENGESALHLAQSEEMAEWLIEKDPGFLFKSDNEERLPIHTAAKHNNIRLLKVILNQKPSNTIDQPDKKNNTPLHIAAFFGSYDAVQLLLKYGSNRWQQNSHGKRPADLIDFNDNTKDLKTLFR